jgi:hypothetical protein
VFEYTKRSMKHEGLFQKKANRGKMDTKIIFQSNRESTARIMRLVNGLTDQQLTSVLPNDWNVAVTLAHLAFWDNRVIHLVEISNKAGKVSPSNFDESLNDILEPFLQAIPPAEAAAIAIRYAETLDQLLENSSPELIEQLEQVNHRWLDRSLHRNGHLDDIESFLK